MTTVEPRIAQRRQRVGEDRARRRLRTLMLALLVITIVAVTWWLLRSPLLSVRDVTVEGAARSSPATIAAGVGVVEGLPTISVDEGAVRSALLSDPWIAAAAVGIRWPGTVVISVTERSPVAVVSDGATAALVAADGMILASASDAGGAVLEVEGSVPGPGSTLTAPQALGGLAFLASLPAELRDGAVVTVDGSMVSGVVAGHAVRLGMAADMEQKARTLAALLESGLEPGAAVDLIAPLHPSVINPLPEVEGETEGPSEGEASG